MKEFYTVVLDRLTNFKGELASEPYEAGWADEALAFLRIHSIYDECKVSFRVQISPDGLLWSDEGSEKKNINKEGVYFLKIKEFGGWLRLIVESNKEVKVTTYIDLKG